MLKHTFFSLVLCIAAILPSTQHAQTEPNNIEQRPEAKSAFCRLKDWGWQHKKEIAFVAAVAATILLFGGNKVRNDLIQQKNINKLRMSSDWKATSLANFLITHKRTDLAGSIIYAINNSKGNNTEATILLNEKGQGASIAYKNGEITKFIILPPAMPEF